MLPSHARGVFARFAGPAVALGLLAAARAVAATSPPAVELVETRVVETALGNPALPETRAVWLEMIGGAKHTLDCEQFYFSTWPGEPMDPIVDAIGAAAKRGVRVRLLLDARMARTYPKPADSLARLANVEVRRVDFGRLGGGVQHAKYFIVDERESFVGSQNFDWRALEHIHELGVRVRDPRLAQIFGAAFAMDWAGADTTGKTPAPPRFVPPALPLALVQAPGDTVRLWPSWSPKRFVPDTMLWDRDAIVRVLDGARREAVLQALTYGVRAYGVEDTVLDRALRRAAARGVRVRLLISDWESVEAGAMGALQALSRLPGIEVKLGTVPAWSAGYIPFARVEHCKYLVVDSLVTWIGTSNWDPGYFHSSRNLAVTLENAGLAAQARRIFETSWIAPGAAVLDPDRTYTPKSHGSSAPVGVRKYGE